MSVTFRTSLLPTAPWGANVTVCDECEAIVMNPAGHATWHEAAAAGRRARPDSAAPRD